MKKQFFATLDQDGVYWGSGRTKKSSLQEARRALRDNPWDGVRFQPAIPCDEQTYYALELVNDGPDKKEYTVKDGVFFLRKVLTEQKEAYDAMMAEKKRASNAMIVERLGSKSLNAMDHEFDDLPLDDKLKVIYRLLR